jgi:hypothetical protein
MSSDEKPEVASSTKIWIGSTVTTSLGIVFGTSLIITGSFLAWRADGILGLFGTSGWRLENIVSGDGKITVALGVVMTMGLLVGLLMQSRAFYMVAVVSSAIVIGLSIYELIQMANRPGITGPGHGLYMVLGGGVAGIMCAYCGYSMMKERRAAGGEARAAMDSGGLA